MAASVNTSSLSFFLQMGLSLISPRIPFSWGIPAHCSFSSFDFLFFPFYVTSLVHFLYPYSDLLKLYSSTYKSFPFIVYVYPIIQCFFINPFHTCPLILISLVVSPVSLVWYLTLGFWFLSSYSCTEDKFADIQGISSCPLVQGILSHWWKQLVRYDHWTRSLKWNTSGVGLIWFRFPNNLPSNWTNDRPP